MKKKIIVSIIVIVLCLSIYILATIVVPVAWFSNRTKEWKKYAKHVESKSMTAIHERLEMTPNEYQELREKLLLEKWSDATDMAKLNVSEYTLSPELFTETERNGEREAFYRHEGKDVFLHVSDNICWETLAVVVHEDVVYLEYEAKLSIAWVPFSTVH